MKEIDGPPMDEPIVFDLDTEFNCRITPSQEAERSGEAEQSRGGHKRRIGIYVEKQEFICLVEEPRIVPMAICAIGHTQDEISAAWREARRAGYTESTELEMDRLTAAKTPERPRSGSKANGQLCHRPDFAQDREPNRLRFPRADRSAVIG